jgi:hypothetical protein
VASAMGEESTSSFGRIASRKRGSLMSLFSWKNTVNANSNGSVQVTYVYMSYNWSHVCITSIYIYIYIYVFDINQKNLVHSETILLMISTF